MVYCSGPTASKHPRQHHCQRTNTESARHVKVFKLIPLVGQILELSDSAVKSFSAACTRLVRVLFAVSERHSGGGTAYTTPPSFMLALRKAVSHLLWTRCAACSLRSMADSSSIRTEVVSVVLAKTSSSLTSSSKPRGSYRAFDVTSSSRFSTRLAIDHSVIGVVFVHFSLHCSFLTLQFWSCGFVVSLVFDLAAVSEPRCVGGINSFVQGMSTFNLAFSKASTALASTSASRLVRAFLAALTAEQLIPPSTSRIPYCKMSDTGFFSS